LAERFRTWWFRPPEGREVEPRQAEVELVVHLQQPRDLPDRGARVMSCELPASGSDSAGEVDEVAKCRYVEEREVGQHQVHSFSPVQLHLCQAGVEPLVVSEVRLSAQVDPQCVLASGGLDVEWGVTQPSWAPWSALRRA
jgi:hypothetical protein